MFNQRMQLQPLTARKINFACDCWETWKSKHSRSIEALKHWSVEALQHATTRESWPLCLVLFPLRTTATDVYQSQSWACTILSSSLIYKTSFLLASFFGPHGLEQVKVKTRAKHVPEVVPLIWIYLKTQALFSFGSVFMLCWGLGLLFLLIWQLGDFIFEQQSDIVAYVLSSASTYTCLMLWN